MGKDLQTRSPYRGCDGLYNGNIMRYFLSFISQLCTEVILIDQPGLTSRPAQ